ncbi:Type VII secretion integral membrane protein EccD OS=Streptomyces albaduncus OX=68172 GN=FHS32_000249 PE=3 SV=1 [Streptomyces griseoloalbus]
MSVGALSRETAGGPAILSRVTLVGERRRVDLVLPAREPVGILLPEIMRLLDDRVNGRPASRHLVTVDGSALDHDSTLESAGVRDGAVLRLVRAEDAAARPRRP